MSKWEARAHAKHIVIDRNRHCDKQKYGSYFKGSSIADHSILKVFLHF